MEPLAAPAPSPPEHKSALAFFAVLLLLFLPALVAQWAQPVAGLAATQLFTFLLPTLVATAGSNLRLVPWLRLRAPRPALLVLGILAGLAGYFVAGGIMGLTQRLVPHGWVETFDLSRLFEGPAWQTLALAALAVGIAPGCEELVFRGYVLSALGLRRPPAVAILGSALLFALLHLDPVRFPALVVLGTAFGWLAWRAGSIWPSVAAHVANNGLAAGLLLAGGPPPEPVPPLPAVAFALAFGVLALGVVILLYRALSPAFVPDPVVLRDPSSPSLEFEPARVPRRLAAAAAAGIAVLLALALGGVVRAINAPR